MRIPGVRGVSALPIVLTITVVLVGIGVAASSQVSSSRLTLERIHAGRLLELAAASAVDEASARLEALLPQVATPTPGADRNIGQYLPPLFEIDPVLTRDSLAEQNVAISKVAIQPSAWRLKMDSVKAGLYSVRETGLFQFTVRVHLPTAGGTIEKVVVCRRLAELRPEIGASFGRIRIDPNNVLRRVEPQ